MVPIFDRFVFLYSRRIPFFSRNFALKLLFWKRSFRNYLKYGKSDMFAFVSIELTRNCNRSCVYCPVSKHASRFKNSELKFSRYTRLIEQLRKLGFDGTIFFSGFGEPLLHKDLVRYLVYARRKLPKNKFILFTNGDFLEEYLIKKLKKLSVVVEVSQHEPVDQSRFAKIKSFQKLYGNILIKRDVASSFLSNRGGSIEVPKQERKRYCYLPSLQLTVDSEGDIILCGDDFFSKHKFGNVGENNIFDIWNNQNFKSLRKDIRKGVFNLEICKSCNSSKK